MNKQLRTEIIALCDYALVSNDNKLSIMGIFDELRSENFPVGFLDKYLVATINGDPDTEYKLTVELEKDNNRKNLLRPIIVNATTSPNGKNNLIIRLTNVGFKDDGNYFFKIYNGNTEIGSTRLKVIDIKKNEKEMLKFSVN